MMVGKGRVLISNGFGRFPLANLAAGLRRRDWDVELITGAYPEGMASAMLRHMGKLGSIQAARLEDRRVGIERERVHADRGAELIQRVGLSLRARGADRVGLALESAGFRLAGRRAAHLLRNGVHPDAYHFRSGFGLASADAARRRGIPTICDHSIVHPAALEPLVRNGGRLPAHWRPRPLDGIWGLVQRDLEHADWVVVNSDFARDTFQEASFDTARVKVIYPGVDPDFMASIPARLNDLGEGPVRLLFAGEVGPRKGADILFRALSTSRGLDWRLDLVGQINPAIAAAWGSFLNDPRVIHHGTVRIAELAVIMTRCEVFVFPSLAEGSARVVGMAMAAGCYVITTPNSGSPVRGGVNGHVVPPGDHDALRLALLETAERRPSLSLVGRANADLIRNEFLTEHYVDRVIAFYQQAFGSPAQTP